MKHWPLIVIFLQIFIIQCQQTDDSPSPTLKPFNPFSVEDDVKVLHDELEKKDTDLNAVIKLWFRRTYAQRMEIKDAYNKTYKDYLYRKLHDISEKPLKSLFVDSFSSPESLISTTIYDVFYPRRLSEMHYSPYVPPSVKDDLPDPEPVGAIEEIVCGNDKHMKDKIAEHYNMTKFGDPLETALANFRSNDTDYETVMTKYCWKGLCQEKKIKPEDVDKEAGELHAIHADKEQDKFMNKLKDLLNTTCEADLQMIFQKYRTLNGPDGKDGINNEVQKAIPNDEITRRAYDYLVRHIEDPCLYWADELDKALKVIKRGKINNQKINRIILSRCELDLGCILQSYKDKHDGQTFINHLNNLETDGIREVGYLLAIGYLCGES